MSRTRKLFVYGTLAPELAPAQISDVTSQMKLIGPATVGGRLYDLGEYPGASLGGLSTRIFGKLYELADDPALWGSLDAYEGFDPTSPATSLFCRRTCTAVLDDGSQIECDIYVCNRRPPIGRLILEGEWKPGSERVDGGRT